MILSLGPSNFHKGAGAEPAGPDQDAFGNCDFVVPRQPPNDFRGGAVDRRKAFAEFGFGLGFDTGSEQTQDVVEHLDLIFAKPILIMQEEICDLPKCIYALFG